ncbi:hypothetical protein CONPUDRAFT_146907 [Coniophora puteana RWD-64-598 SS2]|uniref:Uncharacterized protein n=1 Tax=Coniophora puteana (strain RWD-64-598) TaxID=741705 RepID=A0A5M3MA97_CONPW|nr:uncharacterized protein CONPUDRAFT_146907 [Coniophora puteana RWD-64-598 SS2]EIW75764.1 hypothetical protein CONPUDRAFT_146907 [Coniophora puteana RWD-64-598 SS2]
MPLTRAFRRFLGSGNDPMRRGESPDSLWFRDFHSIEGNSEDVTGEVHGPLTGSPVSLSIASEGRLEDASETTGIIDKGKARAQRSTPPVSQSSDSLGSFMNSCFHCQIPATITKRDDGQTPPALHTRVEDGNNLGQPRVAEKTFQRDTRDQESRLKAITRAFVQLLRNVKGQGDEINDRSTPHMSHSSRAFAFVYPGYARPRIVAAREDTGRRRDRDNAPVHGDTTDTDTDSTGSNEIEQNVVAQGEDSTLGARPDGPRLGYNMNVDEAPLEEDPSPSLFCFCCICPPPPTRRQTEASERVTVAPSPRTMESRSVCRQEKSPLISGQTIATHPQAPGSTLIPRHTYPPAAHTTETRNPSTDTQIPQLRSIGVQTAEELPSRDKQMESNSA